MRIGRRPAAVVSAAATGAAVRGNRRKPTGVMMSGKVFHDIMDIRPVNAESKGSVAESKAWGFGYPTGKAVESNRNNWRDSAGRLTGRSGR